MEKEIIEDIPNQLEELEKRTNPKDAIEEPNYDEEFTMEDDILSI